MGRRSDHSREELHKMALDAARKIADQEGLRGLSARRITREIGYTIGTFYNLFEDFDDLVVHLNGMTLDALFEACANISRELEPEARLHALARHYIAFTRDNAKSWSILFEHRLPDNKSQPDWYREKTLRLLGLVEAAIAPLFSKGLEVERLHSARALWASLHGICSLEAVDKLVSTETVEALSETLVTYYLAGLRATVDE